MKGKRVVLGMSGGVDSSVAAALLLEDGYDVVGVTMKVFAGAGPMASGRCCSLEDVNDARAVAELFGIAYYVFDLIGPFRQRVIGNFIDEYAAGRTPIPCIHCNREIKFGVLMEKAERLGAELVATGHYAIKGEVAGQPRLYRGLDRAKDQSYFLFSLTRQQLSRVLFPLGALTKGQVRRKADELGLALANKPESQEICFVPDGDYGRFLTDQRPGICREGPIVNRRGEELGRHRGIVHYTVGQRRGLGISAPNPLYVLKVDASAHLLVVGEVHELWARGLLAASVNWISEPPPTHGLRIECKVRSTHQGSPAVVHGLPGSRARVVFDSTERAVTPGQAAVFYRGDELVGGGWIESSLPAD